MTLPERVNAIARQAEDGQRVTPADAAFCVAVVRVTVGALIAITGHEGAPSAKHEQVAWAALTEVSELAEEVTR